MTPFKRLCVSIDEELAHLPLSPTMKPKPKNPFPPNPHPIKMENLFVSKLAAIKFREKKVDAAILQLLDQAFIHGCNNDEACTFAGITKSAFQDFVYAHPDYKIRRDQLKHYPKMLAKWNLVEDLISSETKLDTSKWLLERTDPEFSNKLKHDVSGEVKIIPLPIELIKAHELPIDQGASADYLGQASVPGHLLGTPVRENDASHS